MPEGVDRSSPVPAWAQVAQILRRQMDAGALDAGERLPSEQELAVGFDVSRITIRQALAHLAAEGYVERRQGVGTFVSPRPDLVQHDLALSAPWRDRVRVLGTTPSRASSESRRTRSSPPTWRAGFRTRP
ncbi:GntR family transcriptional regulator [Nonomuraea antimicrobica]